MIRKSEPGPEPCKEESEKASLKKHEYVFTSAFGQKVKSESDVKFEAGSLSKGC